MAKGRGLTNGEIALAREAFGEHIPYHDIRFVDGTDGNLIAKAAFRNGNTAITLRKTIYFKPDHYGTDYARGVPAQKGLFVHEMTHVWQYLRHGTLGFLGRYGWQFIRSGFDAPSMYNYQAGHTEFHGAKLEAQAEMAGNYAEAKAVGDTARMAEIAKNLKGSSLFGL